MNCKNLSQLALEFERLNPGMPPSQAWLSGYNAALKNRGKKKKPLDLSFVAQEFSPAMTKWVAYKKERKQSYTQIGVEQCYKHLLELGSNNPHVCMQIVEQSIANNWAGLYEVKNGAIATLGNSQFKSADQRKASVGSLADLAEGVLQKLGGVNY